MNSIEKPIFKRFGNTLITDFEPKNPVYVDTNCTCGSIHKEDQVESVKILSRERGEDLEGGGLLSNEELADALAKVGLIAMANRHRTCHQQYLVFGKKEFEDDEVKIHKTSCDVKGCPLCKYRKSNRLWKRIVNVALQHKHEITHLVLTKRPVGYPNKVEIGIFADQINQFIKHYGLVNNTIQKTLFDAHNKKPLRKGKIKGVLIAFECIPKEVGYHLHAHLILISGFLYQPVEVWSNIVGYHANLKIMGYARKENRVIKKLVSYTTRYAIKNVIQHADPLDRANMILAQYHQRMVRTRGLFFKTPDNYISEWQFLGLRNSLGEAFELVMFIYGNISDENIHLSRDVLVEGVDYG